MSQHTSGSRLGRLAHRRTTTLLAAFAVPLAMAAAGLGTASPALAQAATSLATLSGTNLPGVFAQPTTTTLITGDQVTVTPAAGSTRYSITAKSAMRADGYTPAVHVAARIDPTGTPQINAQPQDVVPYLASGAVDRGLLDVTWLASHETGGELSVVVRYATPMTDAQLSGAAANLPSSVLVQTLDSQNAVQVDVDLTRAGAFWTALTGTSVSTPPTAMTGTLAGGVAAVWATGHQLGSPTTVTPTTEPTYTLTQDVTARPGAMCEGSAVLCPIYSYLIRLDGTGEGGFVLPATVACVDQNTPCHTIRFTYNVPAGEYSVSTMTMTFFNNAAQFFQTDDPEVRVANDTAIASDTTDASKVSVATPLPTDAYNGVLETERVLPDQTLIFNMTFAFYGQANYWATPTQPVTIGSYYFKTSWIYGQPMVTMSVDAPGPVMLHPTYAGLAIDSYTRFPQGTQTLTLVDAGNGTAADFAGIDARGKLALVRNIQDGAHGCLVWEDTLQNALNAGAAGVLFDPTQQAMMGGQCPLPMYPEWDFTDYPTAKVNMPFAELNTAEANLVRGLLSSGTVRINVTDNGQPAYLYDITPIAQGQIPASLAYSYGDKQLAEVDASYPATQRAVVNDFNADWAPDEAISAATNAWFVGPLGQKLYFGPISPDLVYYQYTTMNALDDSKPLSEGTPLSSVQKFAVYDQAGPLAPENWNDQPSAPGVPAAPTQAFQAQPGRWDPSAVCSLCRQGNDFTPWTYLTDGNPALQGFDVNSFLAGFAPNSVHLYQNGQEVPQVSNGYGASEYTLATDPTRYTLTMDGNNTHSTWDFTTGAPATDQTPDGYVCGSVLFGYTGPCQAVPAIFLRYGSGIDLNEAVTAPGAHQIHISAYHQDPAAPAVTGLNVWTSVDGGKTWVAAPVALQGDGSYVATYAVPDVSATDGAVSLKVQARDAGGNDVTQIINDAFRLSPVQ